MKTKTCIVGLKYKGRVYIGGDSQATSTYQKMTMSGRKVFKVGEMLIGYCGSIRAGQVLQFSLKPPAHPDGVDVERYLCTTFINSVRKVFKSSGVMFNEHGVDDGHYFLVGYRKRLFTVEPDNQEREDAAGMAALGSGMAYAMGAMAALWGRGKEPKRTILKALKIVGEHDPNVGPPYYVEVI